jgi:hypothetical protein
MEENQTEAQDFFSNVVGGAGGAGGRFVTISGMLLSEGMGLFSGIEDRLR